MNLKASILKFTKITHSFTIDHSFVRAALKAMNSISKEEEESIKNSGSFIEYVFNMLISKFESKKPEELQSKASN